MDRIMEKSHGIATLVSFAGISAPSLVFSLLSLDPTIVFPEAKLSDMVTSRVSAFLTAIIALRDRNELASKFKRTRMPTTMAAIPIGLAYVAPSL